MYTKVKSEEKLVYRKVKALLNFVYKGQVKVVNCIQFVYNCTHFFADQGRVLSTVEVIWVIQGQQGLSAHFEMALTGRKKSRNVKTNGSL